MQPHQAAHLGAGPCYLYVAGGVCIGDRRIQGFGDQTADVLRRPGNLNVASGIGFTQRQRVAKTYQSTNAFTVARNTDLTGGIYTADSALRVANQSTDTLGIDADTPRIGTCQYIACGKRFGYGGGIHTNQTTDGEC